MRAAAHRPTIAALPARLLALGVTLAMALALLVATPTVPTAQASSHTSLTVNSTVDRVLAAGADTAAGECDTGETVNIGGDEVPECTLRAAIQTANAPGSPITDIDVPAGTYALTIPPVDVSDPAEDSGSLLIDTDVTITGDGAGDDPAQHTIIDAGWREGGDDGIEDRVMRTQGDVALADLTVTGGNAVAGADHGGGIQHRSGTLTLERVHVVGNHAAEWGGGIQVPLGYPGDVEATDVWIVDNLAARGGGARFDAGTHVLTDTRIENNVAGVLGGGLMLSDSAEATLVDTDVIGNEAGLEGGTGVGYGGGIDNRATLTMDGGSIQANDTLSGELGRGGGLFVASGSITTLTGVLVAGNEARRAGGGVFVSSGSTETTIDGSTIAENRVVEDLGDDATGGGIHAEGQLLVTNSTITGNEVDHQSGGGIRVHDTEDVELDSVTLAGNVAADGADGIDVTGAGDIGVRNTILDHAGDDCGGDGTGTSLNHNLTSDATCGFEGTADEQGDAQLEALGDNGGPTATHLIGEAGDAFQAGGTSLATDQRGIARPQGAQADIGALEIEIQQPDACDWRWTGAASDRWDDPDNWDGPAGEVPGEPTDVVCIDEDVNLPVVYDEGQGNDTTIAELSNSEVIDAIGLRIESGSLTLAEASDLPHLGIQLGDDGAFGEPTLLVEESLDVRSPSAWPRGTLGGAGTTTFHDDLAGGADPRTRVLDGHDLLLTAHTRMETPDLFLENGSTITNTGTLEFEGGSWMRSSSPLANRLDNQGTVVKTGGGTAMTNVEFDNAAGATVRAEAGTLTLQAEGQNDGDFVVEAFATIEFAGSVIGRRYVHTQDSTVTGAGTIGSTRSSGFEIDGVYDVGTTSLVAPGVFQTSYGKFNNDDAVTDELIVRFSRPRGPGTLTVTGDVTYLSQDTSESLTIDAAGDLLLSSERNKWFYDDSLVLIAGEATHDEGDVRIRESEMDVAGAYTHTGDDLELDAGILRTPLLDVAADAMLSGIGEVDGDVDSAGTIAPGLAAFRGGPGAIAVTGDLAADGELQIDLEGTADGEFDRVDVSGDATIDGTLTVELGEEFTPQDGDEFVIVTGATVTGTFATEDLPQLEGAQLEVEYREQEVVLRFTGEIDEPEPEPELSACPHGEVPPAGFVDVRSGNVHAEAIDCIAWYEITLGTTATTYDPAGTVTRAQKASFIARLLDRSGVDLPDVDGHAFDDIGGPHAEAISQLAELGIVEGVGDGRFDPGRAVSRDQTAALVVRTLEYVTGDPLPTPEAPFTDIAGNTHADDIAAAAEAGITLGTTATTFEPRAATRRDQMASLLTRTLELLVQQGHVTPPTS